jgi:hypothetical protein
MANVQFIDGQALTPNSFGSFNSYGVWQPINYGGSYGTNGFYLPFSNKTSTTTLGYDFSPAGNNWTTNNISLTAGSTYDSMTDVPTLTSTTAANYCALSPLQFNVSSGGSYSLYNANLTFANQTAAKWSDVRGSMGISPNSGKYYFEYYAQPTGGDYEFQIGIINATDQFNSPVPLSNANGYAYDSGGIFGHNGSTSAYGATWGTSGDVIGVAVDASGSTISMTYYKNNTSQGVAVSGLTGTYLPVAGAAGANGIFSINFGQQPFQYSPPTGFVALNTYNL